MNSLIEVTQTVLFTLAQVEYSTQAEAPSPVSMIFGLLIALVLIGLLHRVHCFDHRVDRSFVEDL